MAAESACSAFEASQASRYYELRSAPTASLSDDDYQELAAFLDDVGLLEIEGTLGLLHAVAIAPSLIPPSAWLPIVLSPEQDNALDAEEMNVFLGLLMRQYNAVLEGLSRGAVIMPEPHEEEACVSFAGGFVAGAELDPEMARQRPAMGLRRGDRLSGRQARPRDG